MPEIWRLAPPSPNMNISPPITMATSASERAKRTGERAFEIARGALPRRLGECQCGQEKESREHHHTHASNESDDGVAGHGKPPALVLSELELI